MHDEASRTYFLLGATSEIGAQVARRLTASGGRVVLSGRSPERLAPLGEELSAECVPLDATDCGAVMDAFAAARAKHGGLAGAVNLAGSLLLKPAHLTSPDEWQSTLQANLTTAFATVRAAGKHMTGGGSVVLVSSAAARLGLANHEAIAAAKAGVIGLGQSAAATYAGKGLRVNIVAPGLTRTPLTERIWGNERSAEASRSMHALGRLGEPEDVASAITWLLDPTNDWITGEVISVDGGLSRVRGR